MSDPWRDLVEKTLGGPVGPATGLHQRGTPVGMSCRTLVLILGLAVAGLCILVLLYNV